MKNVEIYLGGIKITVGEATPQEVADLKKLLEQQSPYKITWTAPNYYPWTTPYYQQPYHTTTCGTATSVDARNVATWNGGIQSSGVSSSTSNDSPVLGSDGNMIKYDYSTYKN